MTCIIGTRTTGGHTLIAADTCISLRTAGDRLVYRDELQKVYEIGPNVIIAITTDNVLEARSLLLQLKSHVDILVPKLIRRGRFSNILTPLKRLFCYLWTGSTAYTGLIIGIAHNNSSRLFFWDTKMMSGPPKEVLPGQLEMSGSILRDQSFSNSLKEELSTVVHGKIKGKALSPREATAVMVTKLSSAFAAEPARTIGVGGLFQVAFFDGENFCFADYESTSMSKTALCPSFQVELYYDQSRQKWVQRNIDTGTEISLLGIDEHRFRVATKNQFTY